MFASGSMHLCDLVLMGSASHQADTRLGARAATEVGRSWWPESSSVARHAPCRRPSSRHPWQTGHVSRNSGHAREWRPATRHNALQMASRSPVTVSASSGMASPLLACATRTPARPPTRDAFLAGKPAGCTADFFNNDPPLGGSALAERGADRHPSVTAQDA